MWTEGEEPWIEPRSWDALADPGRPMPDDVWMGVDLGVRHDSTAIAAAGVDDDGRLVVRVDILKPEGTLPIERVEAQIRDMAARYNVRGIGFDPWSFRRSAELLTDEGLPMLEFAQSAERMSQASASPYRVIHAGILAHDGDPLLRSHVLSGVVKETERGWRLQKDPRSHRPIDALIALTMAAHLATMNDNTVSPMISFV
jgi:phage terminase large subunit-like protein